MIDLKEVITKYPESLESATRFRAYMADLYPEKADQVRIKVLADVISCGVVDEIKAGNTDNLSISRYRKMMEDRYGYSGRLIAESIAKWVQAYAPDTVPEKPKQIKPIPTPKNFANEKMHIHSYTARSASHGGKPYKAQLAERFKNLKVAFLYRLSRAIPLLIVCYCARYSDSLGGATGLLLGIAGALAFFSLFYWLLMKSEPCEDTLVFSPATFFAEVSLAFALLLQKMTLDGRTFIYVDVDYWCGLWKIVAIAYVVIAVAQYFLGFNKIWEIMNWENAVLSFLVLCFYSITVGGNLEVLKVYIELFCISLIVTACRIFVPSKSQKMRN